MLPPLAYSTFAGFWIRFGAFLIDGVLLALIAVVVQAVVNLAYPYAGPAAATYALPINAIVTFGYLAVGDGNGGTLGKRWLGMRVVDGAGVAPGLGKGILRWGVPTVVGWATTLLNGALAMDSASGQVSVVFWAVMILSFGSLIGYMWMVWEKDKQTLYDKLAGTFVVRKTSR